MASIIEPWALNSELSFSMVSVLMLILSLSAGSVTLSGGAWRCMPRL
jgi:hypothetical protein